MLAVQATAYVHRLIERTKRLRAAMEQIERDLSTVVDQHNEWTPTSFFWAARRSS